MKVIAGHELHENPVRLPLIDHGYGHRIRMTRQAAEGMGSFSEILEIQERNDLQVTALRCLLRLHGVQRRETGDFLDRQRVQKESVDDGEDGGIRADAQSKSQSRHNRKGRAFPQGSERVAKISPEVL